MNGGDRGGVRILVFSEVTLFKYNVSKFCRRLQLALIIHELGPGDKEALPGVSHVTRLNFKASRVGVYKCLSLIVCFAVTVAIWPREVVSCRDFILRAVATFWAMSLVGIYPRQGKFTINLGDKIST